MGEFMEKYVVIFFIVWLLSAIPTIIFAIRGINKAKKTFEGIENQPSRFREKGASGYSKKSFITRMGGANKALDIILTDTELCIKGINAVFSLVGFYYDLTHRIRRDKILNIQKMKNKIEIKFISSTGKQTDVVLILKNGEQFIAAAHG